MAQQTKLYSAGRTNPGRIVTNAKPGQSPHNFGLAQDYVLFRAGKPVWSAKDPVFAVMANVADQCGLESGLRFANLGDAGHIQLKYWNA
jgi:peptidoglycan L-alanyl-D-glutamate endopeptidase CwlK